MDHESTENQQPTGTTKTAASNKIDSDEIIGGKKSKAAPERLGDTSTNSENSINVKSLLNDTLAFMKRIESSLKITNDADLCFLLSLHPFLKQMSGAQKLNARIKMVNCLLAELE